MVTLAIKSDLDPAWCRLVSARFARDLGFDEGGATELAIVVSELATNVLKFAGSGELTLTRAESSRVGVTVLVEDRGPGIEDIEEAFTDGYSEGRHLGDQDTPLQGGRGLGNGLGAVRRLMDEVTISNRKGGGTRVVAHKWLP